MNPFDASRSRRSFLEVSAMAAVAGSQLASAEEAASDATGRPNEFPEPPLHLPLVCDADVIICGGGPAGVTAAITAARSGARVRLFEWRGCLGGVWTAGLLGYLLDFDKTGFALELSQKLSDRGLRNGTSRKSISYQPEGMKLLLEELCLEAGVQFQFHTKVSAAYREGRRLRTVVTESKSGREAWQAPIFVDATGDGDLGSLAGCSFEIGQSSDCPCQPMSLNALLVCRDATALEPFLHGPDPSGKDELAKNLLREEIVKTGHFPSYSKPTLWQVRDDLLLVMMNHEYGVKPFDAAAVTVATVRARAEVNKIVAGLRNLGGPWSGLQLVATAEQIGVRDGRRIAGRYKITKDDVSTGSRFDDAVTRPTFPVDIHALSADINKKAAYTSAGITVVPYDIPLRALIAKDVDGLMMAGRCISGDFVAHASYRVTGNAVAMGEAAGAVAAIAAASKRLPHEVAWSEGAAAITKIHNGRGG
jgi:hypothetical protein